MSDVTLILSQIEDGDEHAAEQLLPLVYEELKKLAAARMAQEKQGQTLQATALVHEAYIRLVDGDKAQHWNSRGHFFGAAAEAMRRILVDNARRKLSAKGGGEFNRVELIEHAVIPQVDLIDMIQLDEALSNLEMEAPEKAQLVKLRFFAGLSIDDAALSMGISQATAKRYWVFSRAWLFGQMDAS
jgi:RNA polymerase sigma factor (TIGR02999 family)